MTIPKQTKRSSTLLILMVLIIIVSSPLLSPAETGEKMSLKKAIEAGIHQDDRYKNQLIDQSIAKVNSQKAEMKKYFNLDFNGSYLFKSEKMEINFFPGKIIEAGTMHNYDMKVALAQPIYTGNIISNSIKLEMEKENLETYKTKLLEIELASRIKASYFTFRLLEKKRASLNLLLENLKLHSKRVKDLFTEDLVRKSDVLETEIKISETEMNIEDLDRMMTEEKINFKKLSTIDIETVDPGYTESTEALETSLNYYKEHHPVFRTANNNIRQLQLKKKIVAGAYLPQVSTFAELHYGKPGLDLFKNKWGIYFQGGLGVNLKLWDWNQKKKDNSVIDHSIEKITNQQNEWITETRKTLSQLYARMDSIQKQLILLDQLIATASEDTKLKEELYKESQVSNVDYLSSVLTQERYQSMRDERLVEYGMVQITINSLIGRIGE